MQKVSIRIVDVDGSIEQYEPGDSDRDEAEDSDDSDEGSHKSSRKRDDEEANDEVSKYVALLLRAT